MARHDRRERVPAHRLPDTLRRAGLAADALRDLAVGQRLARRDRPRHLVDAPIEVGHALHVEWDSLKVVALAVEQPRDAIDRALNLGRRCRLAQRWEAPPQARATLGFGRFWELHTDDLAIAPGYPA